VKYEFGSDDVISSLKASPLGPRVMICPRLYVITVASKGILVNTAQMSHQCVVIASVRA
jgi:hypothetical protein